MLDLLGLFRKKQQPLTFSSIAFSRRGPWINRHDCKYFALFWSAEKAGWGSLTFRPDVSQVYARYRPFAPWLDQYLSGVHPLFCLIITDRNLAALEYNFPVPFDAPSDSSFRLSKFNHLVCNIKSFADFDRISQDYQAAHHLNSALNHAVNVALLPHAMRAFFNNFYNNQEVRL